MQQYNTSVAKEKYTKTLKMAFKYRKGILFKAK